MHKLDITYHNTFNCKTLRIEDNSVYDEDITPNNLILEVKPPGLLNYIPFYFANKNWKAITLNCSTLQLCCTKQPCKLTEIPDGIYDLKYSINPNEKSIIEFSHMRVCKIMSNYIKLVGLYFSSKYTRSVKENDCIEKELLHIKDLIDGSVYSVEELLDNTLGLDMYQESLNRIKKLNNGNFANCCK